MSTQKARRNRARPEQHFLPNESSTKGEISEGFGAIICLPGLISLQLNRAVSLPSHEIAKRRSSFSLKIFASTKCRWQARTDRRQEVACAY
jgi:hypothetical protein